MNRINITKNGQKTGTWFDESKTESFDENMYWDGSNHISYATEDQFKHERLEKTKSNRFILSSWSDYQGSVDSNELIDVDQAAEWLVKNNYTDEDIPEILHKAVNELEVK